MQNNNLTAPITSDEISEAISRLRANKSPGGDGFPSEWYQAFKAVLVNELMSDYDIDLLCLTETWLSHEDYVSLNESK